MTTLTDEQRALLEEWATRWEGPGVPQAVAAALRTIDAQREEIARRKEELRLAQCPNPRDPEHGGHCETCSGLSVARTRQLHQQEDRIAALEAERDELREALRGIIEDPHCIYGAMDSYSVGVVDGHRCAAKKAQDALRKEGK